MPDLFRTQVIEAQSNPWLGSISLAQPRRTWALTIATCGLGCAVILFLSIGTYTQRSPAQGRLVPADGLTSVTPALEGFSVVFGQETEGSSAYRASQRF